MNYPIFFTVSAIFLLFCAFFSATEIAFTSLNRKRLEKRAEKVNEDKPSVQKESALMSADSSTPEADGGEPEGTE